MGSPLRLQSERPARIARLICDHRLQKCSRIQSASTSSAKKNGLRSFVKEVAQSSGQ
jgi:hypothetical protein